MSTNSYYKISKQKVSSVKVLNNKIKTYELNDDKRRYVSFKIFKK